MTIRNFWLDDGQMQQIAARTPQTRYGQQLFPQWAANYPPPLLTSATYRGATVVLARLLNRLNQHTATILAIEQAIVEIDDILKSPEAPTLGEDFRGAAGITLTNAWHTSHDHGLTTPQAMAAYESEMIYAARMFLDARRREIAGETLL